MSILIVAAMVLGGMTLVSTLLVVATMRSSQISQMDPYCAEKFAYEPRSALHADTELKEQRLVLS